MYWGSRFFSPFKIISSVQFSHSVVSNSATPWIAAHQASLSITNSRSSLKLMSIKSVMPSSHLLLYCPLLLLPPIPPSIRVFSNESTLHGGKTIALTRRTFVGKVMSLLLNMLSRSVITFLPRSKQVSFNFMAAMTICSDFGAQKNKVWHCFHCFPIYSPWSDGTGCHHLSFLNIEH